MSNFESIMVYVETLNEKPIPYNNEFYLSSSIREILSNTPFFYDDDIHGDNEWTKYTMSRIFPLDDDKEFNEDGIYTDDYSFIFRSLDKNISRVLKGSLGINPTLRLDDSKGKVKEISSIDDPNFDEMTNFKSRSPVLIRTPSSFEEVLANHIVETYKEYTEERTNVDVNVKIDEYDKNIVRVTSKKEDIKAPAYDLEGTIEAPEKILEVIYFGGLGSLTGMGLGCWDVVE